MASNPLTFDHIRLDYVPCCPAYVEVFMQIRQNPKAIINYRLYLYARMKERISDEENKKLWEWIRRCE